MAHGETASEAPGRLAVTVGEFFVGTPYRGGTLETRGAERLVVNLRELDCVTFIETVVALTLLGRSRKVTFDVFRRLLGKIRYRQGRLRGYASRLHYFSDWIYDNERKGIARDVTEEIGGRPFRRSVDFMTAHRDLYPRLRRADSFRRMKSVENAISKRKLFFIPKEDVTRVEKGIRDGDLVAVTAETGGLDILHVGIAVRMKGRVRLLHASSAEGEVVLSSQTLFGYLMEKPARSGIMVARLAE